MEAIDNLSKILEALLFTASKPITAKELAKILEIEETEIKKALTALYEQKKDAGVILLENGTEYQLATNSAFSPQVKSFLNAELRETLTDATVEVLAIIAYRQPISKAEIEAIRGVNSQYSLRALLMRGLIEKIQNPNDARSLLYQTTTEFLMHLGLTSTKDLPEFEKLVASIKLPATPALEAHPSEEMPEIPIPKPANDMSAEPTASNSWPAEKPGDPEEKTEAEEEDDEGDDEEEADDDDDKKE